MNGMFHTVNNMTVPDQTYQESQQGKFSVRKGFFRVGFCIRIDVRFYVRFPAQGNLQYSF
jgi:hypothetical protein